MCIRDRSNGQLTKVSKANNSFTKKVKTWDCQYKRIDTGKSEVDTWGIFVGKDKPTILNIHGGPATQYAFTFLMSFKHMLLQVLMLLLVTQGVRVVGVMIS